jgi:hypothetical protein
MPSDFLKTDSQLLETGTQTPICMIFLDISFYKNSLDPNKILASLLFSSSALEVSQLFQKLFLIPSLLEQSNI